MKTITCNKCNEIKDIDKFQFRKDSQKYRNICNECRMIEHYKWKKIYYFNNPKKKIKTYVKARAKKDGIEFSLEEEDIEVPEVCPILGIKLNYNNNTIADNSPSLDRIDNTKGYIKGNVKTISCKANRIKNSGTADEHEKIANYIEKYMKEINEDM